MPLFEGLSYGAQKTAAIFDIGSAYTKCGFAGENGPRAIVPSEVKRQKTGLVVKIRDVTDPEELYSVLVEFVHFLFFRHLLVNPKERRIVIVESILTPSKFRNTLAKVLFTHYEVPSVLFAPSHLVSLFTLGLPSALVLDCGYTETLVLPVYEGTPLLKAWQAIPLAAKAVHSFLENELFDTARVCVGREEERSLTSVIKTVEEKVLEDIKVRCCFVTKLDRAKQIQAARVSKNEQDKIPSPPPDVDYPLDGGKILKFPGKIREHTAEVLFEQDNEQTSIATLLLDAILRSPIDVRKTLAENIMITGGTSMLPGFKSRLVAELNELLQRSPYKEELAIQNLKFHQIPAKENYVAWLGGAILGDLEILPNRSVSRENYQQNGLIPDWSTIQDVEESDEKSQLHTRK